MNGRFMTLRPSRKGLRIKHYIWFAGIAARLGISDARLARLVRSGRFPKPERLEGKKVFDFFAAERAIPLVTKELRAEELSRGYFSTAEIATASGVTPATVIRWARQRGLPDPRRVSGRLWFERRQIAQIHASPKGKQGHVLRSE